MPKAAISVIGAEDSLVFLPWAYRKIVLPLFMQNIVSWHEMMERSHETIISCHETTISSCITFAEAPFSCYDNRSFDVVKATVGMMSEYATSRHSLSFLC